MDNIKSKLKKEISLERYEHTLRVCDVALEMAELYDYKDEKKLKQGALLHDCAKYPNKEKLIAKAIEYKLEDHNYFENNIQLLHGPLGVHVAMLEYGIQDKEVLNAIKYHTTGRKNMTLLEKIIFLADYIEPKRDFKGLEEVRDLIYSKKIDEAMYLALNQNIKHISKIGKYLAIDTIEARNDLINKIHN